MNVHRQPNKAIAFAIQHLLDAPLKNWQYPNLGTKLLIAVLDTIKEALLRGETVRVQGFGTFKVVERKPHPTPNNILTNINKQPVYSKEQHTYKPRRRVVFRPAASLSAMLNLPTDGHEPNFVERRSQRRWRLHED